MPALELGEVAEAFELIGAFLAEGSAVLDGEGIAKHTQAATVAQQYLAAFKRCLDGAHAPAKIVARESPSGLMLDRDTPGPVYVEFQSEHQGP